MKEEMRKSLTDLIDETLLELEELKKSRFSAAEIKIEGPGEGIAGKPTNGKLDAAKADDEEKEEEAEEEKEEEAEKAEGKNDEAAKAECAKAEDEEDEEEEDDDKKKKSFNFEKEVKKSKEETESLLKSFVEERVKPLEEKLTTIFDLVSKIAGQPVPPKGTTANVVPLKKSADDASESLSKSEIASKLFELKKSGTKVDSLDITRAEMGQDLQKIVAKYKIS